MHYSCVCDDTALRSPLHCHSYKSTGTPVCEIASCCPPTCSPALTPEPVHAELQRACPSPQSLWPSLAASSPSLSPTSRLGLVAPSISGATWQLCPIMALEESVEASRLLRCAPSPGRWAAGCSECERWMAKDTGEGGALWALTLALPGTGWSHLLW